MLSQSPGSLPVGDFKPRRDQRSACHRWNRFVYGEDYRKELTRLYPKSKSEKAKQRHDFDLVSAVHESEHANIRKPLEPAHRFDVTLEPDTFTQEKYDLYLNYQISVHHEDASKNTPDQFRKFLCNSPLERVERVVNESNQPLGSFHQMYRLDGRLIAMGVIDLVPSCVSGVYFIYHSDFEKWAFGKLSALREACLALEGHYDYYYMGYYIHSCPKMRYKNDYPPQYFLDLNSLEWNPLDDFNRTLMDKHYFVSISKLQERAKVEGVDISELSDDHDRSRTTESMENALYDQEVSLFDLDFPGMMTLEQMKQAGIFTGAMQIIDSGGIHPLLVRILSKCRHFVNQVCSPRVNSIWLIGL
jgi:arginyl-tRNA---protein transferase